MTDSTPALYRGCDAADIDGMVRNVARIKAAGLSFAMTYLKWTKPAHIAALHGAGLAVGLIFEAGTSNALSGAGQGKADGVKARQQAQSLGAPSSIPIFATVDSGVGASRPVIDYFAAFQTNAGYADGELLRTLPLAHPWLAGAMGWPGSRDYYANGPWVIVQGTPMRGGHQLGMDWPDLGFEYDPDLARNLDWAWQALGVALPTMPAVPPTITSAGQGLPGYPGPDLPTRADVLDTVNRLQTQLKALGLYRGAIDSQCGPVTSAAAMTLYRRV